MEPKELRIGNIVNFDDEQYTINGISQPMADDPYEVELKTKIGMFIGDVPVEDLEGVPIAVKRLEKLGFKTVDSMDADGDEDHYYLLNVGKFRLVSLRPFEKVELDMSSISVKYVHKLQNLYFELKGSELTQNN